MSFNTPRLVIANETERPERTEDVAKKIFKKLAGAIRPGKNQEDSRRVELENDLRALNNIRTKFAEKPEEYLTRLHAFESELKEKYVDIFREQETPGIREQESLGDARLRAEQGRAESSESVGEEARAGSELVRSEGGTAEEQAQADQAGDEFRRGEADAAREAAAEDVTIDERGTPPPLPPPPPPPRPEAGPPPSPPPSRSEATADHEMPSAEEAGPDPEAEPEANLESSREKYLGAYKEYRKTYEANWAPRGFGARFSRTADWNRLNDSIRAVLTEFPLPPGNAEAERSSDPAVATVAADNRRRFVESLESRGIDPIHAGEIYRVELAKSEYDAARTAVAVKAFKGEASRIRQNMTRRYGEARTWTPEARQEYQAFIAAARGNLFHNFIIREAAILREARVAEMPPREKTIYRKAMEGWISRPRWQRILVSSAVTTLGVAAFSPVGIGVGAAAAMFSSRVVRGLNAMMNVQIAAGLAGAASEAVYFRGARKDRERAMHARARSFNLKNISIADEIHERHEDAEAADKRRKAILKGLAGMAIAGIAVYEGFQDVEAVEDARTGGTGGEMNSGDESGIEGEGGDVHGYDGAEADLKNAPQPETPDDIIPGGKSSAPPEVPRSSSGPFPPGMEPGEQPVPQGNFEGHIQDTSPPAEAAVDGGDVGTAEATTENNFDKELATIREGEGVWHAVRRQLMARVEKDPKHFGLSEDDLADAAKVKEAVNRETQRILIEEKMIGSDGSEVRVAHPGAVVGLEEDHIVISEGDTYDWKPAARAEPIPAEVDNNVRIADGQPPSPAETGGADPVEQYFDPKEGGYIEYLNDGGGLKGALENQVQSRLGGYFNTLPSVSRGEVIEFLSQYIEAHPSLIEQRIGGDSLNPTETVNFTELFADKNILREALRFPDEARMLRAMGFSPDEYLGYDYVNILRDVPAEDYLRRFDPHIGGGSIGETEYFIQNGRTAGIEISHAHVALADFIRDLARTHDIKGMPLGDFIRNYGALRSQ